MLAAILCLGQTLGAEQLEYKVKAAYLQNFLNYVEWPDDAGGDGSRPNICVLGPDPFGPALEDALRNQGANAGRAKRIASTVDARDCRVVFVGHKKPGDVRPILSELQQMHVLTVGESTSFLEQGGIILLFLDAGRVAFEINPQAATRAGLRVSAKLMRLSRSAR